eukprot:scaffold90929_cov30-Tisochrysis_lutea.AAC.9
MAHHSLACEERNRWWCPRSLRCLHRRRYEHLDRHVERETDTDKQCKWYNHKGEPEENKRGLQCAQTKSRLRVQYERAGASQQSWQVQNLLHTGYEIKPP